MKGSPVTARSDLAVGLLSLRKSQISRESNDAAQPGIEMLQAFQIEMRQPLGGDFTPLDPARELSQGSEGDVLVI